jgi:hypothetical protein
MILRSLALAAVLAFALPTFSVSHAAAPAVNNMSVQEFLAFHDDVAGKVNTRDFEALSRSERSELTAAQAEIRAALAGKQSMSDLDDAGKLVVFNAHEKVVALVNKAEDERLVCVQKKRLGSHRHTLECRTVAQIREERESARGERMRIRTCDPASGGCGS